MSTPVPVVRGWHRVPAALKRWSLRAVTLLFLMLLPLMPVPVVLFFRSSDRQRRSVPSEVLKKRDE